MTDGGDGPVLVVSAHAADFVWRAGGALALASRSERPARIVCLSYGERGESASLWQQPGMTVDAAKATRRAEAQRAADVLGAEVTFLDAGDYPLSASPALLAALVDILRRVQPAVMLVHSNIDPYNYDHPVAADLALRARVIAQAAGYPSEHPALGAPPVFRFEPHQPEMCEFRPDVLLDITSVFEVKRRAMGCMRAQEHLWQYYTELAARRGVQARRNGAGAHVRYAEAYQRVFPQVAEELR